MQNRNGVWLMVPFFFAPATSCAGFDHCGKYWCNPSTRRVAGCTLERFAEDSSAKAASQRASWLKKKNKNSCRFGICYLFFSNSWSLPSNVLGMCLQIVTWLQYAMYNICIYIYTYVCTQHVFASSFKAWQFIKPPKNKCWNENLHFEVPITTKDQGWHPVIPSTLSFRHAEIAAFQLAKAFLAIRSHRHCCNPLSLTRSNRWTFLKSHRKPQATRERF